MAVVRGAEGSWGDRESRGPAAAATLEVCSGGGRTRTALAPAPFTQHNHKELLRTKVPVRVKRPQSSLPGTRAAAVLREKGDRQRAPRKGRRESRILTTFPAWTLQVQIL